MSGLILPGQAVDFGQHRSRSQREIDALRGQCEALGIQNQRAFYLMSALVKRFGPVITISLEELNALTDTTLCGFAVSKENGDVTLYTSEMAPVIMAALRDEVVRKNNEANGQAPLGEEPVAP